MLMHLLLYAGLPPIRQIGESVQYWNTAVEVESLCSSVGQLIHIVEPKLLDIPIHIVDRACTAPTRHQVHQYEATTRSVLSGGFVDFIRVAAMDPASIQFAVDIWIPDQTRLPTTYNYYVAQRQLTECRK